MYLLAWISKPYFDSQIIRINFENTNIPGLILQHRYSEISGQNLLKMLLKK